MKTSHIPTIQDYYDLLDDNKLLQAEIRSLKRERTKLKKQIKNIIPKYDGPLTNKAMSAKFPTWNDAKESKIARKVMNKRSPIF